MSRKTALSLAGLLVFAAALWLARARFGFVLDRQRALALLQSVRERWWAPAAFVGVYALMCALALPGTIPTLAGGAAWGAGWGTLYNVLGSNLGATAAFFVARFLGREWVQRLSARTSLGRFEEGVEKNGFQVILTMRLIPVFPFNGVNFGAGLSSIRYRDYFLGSLLGMLPATFVYTYFADSLLKGAMEGRSAFGRVALAGLLLAALSFLPRLLSRRAPKLQGGLP